MRLAFFADLHANREAFEACLRRLGKVGYDRAVILGDIVGYGADASWTVDTVQRMVDDGAVCVLGNHDVQAPGPDLTLPLREGHGLTGMRERIDAFGGSLRIQRAGRGGVRIEAAFPA